MRNACPHPNPPPCAGEGKIKTPALFGEKTSAKPLLRETSASLRNLCVLCETSASSAKPLRPLR